MKRDLYSYLTSWKTNKNRMPLLLRGARQVGKTWLVREFGKGFENFVEFNFEKNERLSRIFQKDLSPQNLLPQMQAFSSQKIDPATTLIFFDEIQECPNAIRALRYFKEEKPELPVIATGSLLEFELEKIGVPVGRIEFAHLYPFSFGEFLEALGRHDLRESCQAKLNNAALHDVLSDFLKQYFLLGDAARCGGLDQREKFASMPKIARSNHSNLSKRFHQIREEKTN